MVDHYLTLGVDRCASGREITRAYRRLARRYHPDVSDAPAATTELFLAVQEAYEVLSDLRRRAVYDARAERQQPPAGSQRPAARPAAATTFEPLVPVRATAAWRDPATPPLDARNATAASALAIASAALLPLTLLLARVLVAGAGAYLWAAAGSLLALVGSTIARSLSEQELDRLWRWTAKNGRGAYARSRQAADARRRIDLADDVTAQGWRFVLLAVPILFLLVHR